ncbi:MAG: hypothetical protein ACLR9I_05700 [Eisenbergiella sp.]
MSCSFEKRFAELANRSWQQNIYIYRILSLQSRMRFAGCRQARVKVSLEGGAPHAERQMTS